MHVCAQSTVISLVINTTNCDAGVSQKPPAVNKQTEWDFRLIIVYMAEPLLCTAQAYLRSCLKVCQEN